jgi:hypothetical protein
MWAADDDNWDKRYIEVLAGLLEKHPNAVVAASNYSKFTEDGVFKGQETLTDRISELTYRDIVDAVFSLRKINVATYGLFRREELQSVMRRGFRKCDAPDRVLFADVAFLDRTVLLTNEYLYQREMHRRSFAVRNGLAQNKYLALFTEYIGRVRYYIEYLRIIFNNRWHDDKMYFMRRLVLYIASMELMCVKRLPYRIVVLVPYNRKLRGLAKKCLT